MIEKIPPDLSKFLICPMPGLLVALNMAEAGDKVEAGQPLAVVEAMKMENILRAEKAGTVKKVNAAASQWMLGDSLARGRDHPRNGVSCIAGARFGSACFSRRARRWSESETSHFILQPVLT
jgi:hypothetical protein